MRWGKEQRELRLIAEDLRISTEDKGCKCRNIEGEHAYSKKPGQARERRNEEQSGHGQGHRHGEADEESKGDEPILILRG